MKLLIFIFLLGLANVAFAQEINSENRLLDSLNALSWKSSFTDSFTKKWQKNWFLDGKEAKLTYNSEGLDFLFRS